MRFLRDIDNFTVYRVLDVSLLYEVCHMFFKFTIYIFIIIMLFISCQSRTEMKKESPKSDSITQLKSENKDIIPNEKDTLEIFQNQSNQESESSKINENESFTEFFFDNEHLYSSTFISKLRSAKRMKKIEFTEDVMILNEEDTVQFPEFPKIDKRSVLTGRKDDLAIALTIKRINYTSIEYRIEMVEFGKSNKMENGIADLGIYFFLGSESDTDQRSNVGYFSTEYSNYKDSCYTKIRIGNIDDSPEKPLLAKIVKNCNGEIKNIDLDNFPNLREK
ncbi:hypothetical protein [uncultured Aquimarina sp.]|uniref:hypothetical protein n=1 Tax=uncultured Aquimarina sp. TaxID=575652 RepID=UPI00262262A1|nr:hypothetical protein [uncultured Aquimarina sp.]